ncbi:Sec-independent protein translocase subunit TatB [Shewanella sp. BF02_Schw]|uniref:Sec-independent protein translocase protein TatB n=1 Tax=Shewanella sp. BF02_Schw TaxID=394908 RepID=UPI00177EBF7B|nr:Sec-independent protein translocase protein TatB [Shewanella sp. BF02_Schw]MBO1896440.1 Sec-independent protein translocase subunit TatB [Shewanella sp. BF02_Schw]
MFDGIGFMELLLIGILGLVVLGPERLPVAVRSLTGWIRALKRMANSVKDELEQELKIDQLHADLKKAESKGLANLSPELQESIDQLKKAAESVNRPYKVEDTSPVEPKKSADESPSVKEAKSSEVTSENSSTPKSNG